MVRGGVVDSAGVRGESLEGLKRKAESESGSAIATRNGRVARRVLPEHAGFYLKLALSAFSVT